MKQESEPLIIKCNIQNVNQFTVRHVLIKDNNENKH